jgi:hypothetical protein
MDLQQTTVRIVGIRSVSVKRKRSGRIKRPEGLGRCMLKIWLGTELKSVLI